MTVVSCECESIKIEKRQNCIKTSKSSHYKDLYCVKLTRPSPTLDKPNAEGRTRLCCLTGKFQPVAPSPQPYTQTQAYTQNVWFRGNYSGPSTPERKQPARSENKPTS